MTASRKLLAYALGLAALVGGGELAARALEPSLAAAADRVAFKAALLQRQGPLERVFIGTSRLNDGVRARALSGFNASVPSSSLDAQRKLLEVALGHPGVKQVVLEISPEQAWNEEAAPPADHEPVVLLRHRRAFALENLPRLLGLLFAGRFDGSEWFRNRWFLEGLRELEGLPEARADAQPRRLTHGAPTIEWSGAIASYAEMAGLAQGRGVEVTFVVPPADPKARDEQCRGSFAVLPLAVAHATGRPVLDYACAELPDAFFTDRTHLGALGRAWLTRSLGQAL